MGFGKKKKPADAVIVQPMKWQCPCGCRNWAHFVSCASCGSPKVAANG